ncbi:hypothetical protein LJB85_03545 [Porphyromonadaceae bacterium OttesenSCG-928-L07]|nr:hypothetical protein [Porphyromonadaceae bacterium OttesenSCG-928-L07]MDL2251456.1 hypothetical protein [Odoribacter sp. OttesenSCG-928-J03]MDL2282953.1 hypothetical protein [Odoribacter sp. OttesenSCG-928-G04]
MKILLTTILLVLLACGQCVYASEAKEAQKLTYQFYGTVRGDASIDTRKSVAAFEGLLLLYPLDNTYRDANGKDINRDLSSGFYGFNSRAGVNVGGLSLFNAKLSAQLEGDFAGFSGANGNSSILRIRQAFIKMQWEKMALTVGQTWHPLFLSVIPNVISLSTGAPFSPFNRSPQIKYEYSCKKFQFLAAALYQFQFTSNGPNGKSNTYQRDAILPELYLGVGYKSSNLVFGAGVNYLTLVPRNLSEMGTEVYKVDERISSVSGMAYVRYTKDLFTVGAKTIYGQNLANQTMLGGYGVKSIDPLTGERKYTNFNHTSSWVDLAYGRKYKGSVFAGYLRNLGTGKALVEGSSYFGDGLAVSELYRLCATFTYNVPHFSLGLEWEMTTAGYGDAGTFNYKKGRFSDSHSVTNQRVVAVISYSF